MHYLQSWKFKNHILFSPSFSFNKMITIQINYFCQYQVFIVFKSLESSSPRRNEINDKKMRMAWNGSPSLEKRKTNEQATTLSWAEEMKMSDVRWWNHLRSDSIFFIILWTPFFEKKWPSSTLMTLIGFFHYAALEWSPR